MSVYGAYKMTQRKSMEAKEESANTPFATPIPIIILIFISRLEIFGILRCDLRIRQVIAGPAIQLIQSFPLKLIPFLGQVSSSGDGALQSRSPDSQGMVFTGSEGLLDEGRELECVLFAAGREFCVATDLASDVEHGFAVLSTLCINFPS